MVCHLCQAENAKKFGRTRDGRQRFRCRTCRRTFSERRTRTLPAAMRISPEKAELILMLLCEGSGIRSISRTTGAHQVTILKLLTEVGAGCERLASDLIRNIEVKDVQGDEVWSYVRCKEGAKARKGITDPDSGDAYCFTALERHSKLLLAWHLGRRTKWDAHDFMAKLSVATAGRFQLSTDGFNAYPDAVEYNLGDRADYAQLVKEYGQEGGEEARRYAPPRLIGAEKISISGNPDEARICTSHVERHNWTLRGHLRRMTRLSNGFSRKRANLRAALALFFAYYNFCRMHKSIRMTPAMAAGIARKPWTMADLLTATMVAA
jgi:transposase-like protein/IS1 family transposase